MLCELLPQTFLCGRCLFEQRQRDFEFAPAIRAHAHGRNGAEPLCHTKVALCHHRNLCSSNIYCRPEWERAECGGSYGKQLERQTLSWEHIRTLGIRNLSPSAN